MGSFDVQVECPHCGAGFAVPRIRAGRREPCPVCRGAVDVPAQAAEGEATAPAPEPLPAGPAAEELPEQAADVAPAGFSRVPIGTVPEVPAEEEAEFDGASVELPAGPESGRAVVCCAEGKKVNPMAAGPVLARHTGQAVADARRQVVRGLGLLADGIGFDMARRLVAELRAGGVQAFAVPGASVPALARRSPLIRVYGADAEALRIQTDVHGAIASVPWGRLAAGVVTRSAAAEPSQTEIVADEEYVPGSGVVTYSTYRHKEPHQAEAQVTLVVEQGASQAGLLAFSEEQVRYAYLEERLRPSHELNFRLFLGDVLRWGRGAFFSAAFRAAALGERAHVVKVVGKVDYQSHVRWAMCCAAARGRFGAA